MKAVIITEPGEADVLAVSEVPAPQPGPGEVLIAVHATALNRADLLQRRGHYPPPAGAPPYPGLECSGHIIAVGDGVTRWRGGERVMALLGGGGYAEQVAVPEENVIPLPDTMDLTEAAAIPEAWLTAYSNMIEIGRLREGESVLIHAGGSGVGTAAIQLARARGARIFSTASGGKLEALQQLGVEIAVDYQTEDFAARVQEVTQGRGVDLIIDFIGAPYWADNLRSLALWGRLVLVGLMGGRHTEVDLGLFLSKKLSVHGSTLRDRTLAQKGRLVAAFNEEIMPLFAAGLFKPVIDPQQFTLDEIVAAHRYMEANQNFGKILIRVAGS